MIFNIQKIDELSQNIIDVLKRFPMASFSAFLVTIIAIAIIEVQYYQINMENISIIIASKVAFVASLGIVLFPALRLFWSNILMTLIGVLLLAGYYYILPYDINRADTNIIFRHNILILATFLMFFWVPFINVKISNKNIWEWTQNLILAFVATILFSLLLYAGIALALYAIERLFNIDISNRRYLQLLIAIFGIYGVNLFLSHIPKYILLLQARTYTKAEVIFTKYILTSLTIGYFFILFTYSAKILITSEWPAGIVAWISVIFSLVAITTYLFWTPLWKEESIKFKRAIWIAILLQSLMLGMSIWIRVREYGITESRYFISLFGAWLILMSLYFIFRKRASYKWLFVTLTILLIGSQFGKYSAIKVSRENQIMRLTEMLKDNNLSEDLDIKVKKNIYNTISYLYSNHGIGSLNTIFPETIKEYKESNSTNFPSFALKKLGLGDVSSWSNRGSNIYINLSKKREIIDIKDYNWLILFSYNKNFKKSSKIVNSNIDIELKKSIIKIKSNSRVVEIDLTDFIKKLANSNSNYLSLKPERMEYIKKSDSIDIKISINSISINRQDNSIIHMECYIFID